MNKNLSDINEKNLFDLYDYYAENSNASREISGNYKWVNTKHFPWPNFIYNLSEENLITRKEISNLAEAVKKKSAPEFWIVRESSILDNLEDIFFENNIRPVETWPGMAIELNKPVLDKYNEIEGFEVRNVKTEDELNHWLSIVGRELFDGNMLERKFFLNEINKEKIKLYLGIYEGEPVSTSMMFTNGESAGLYMIATLDKCRGKGLGTNITLKPLIDAFNSGCSYGILQASKMGESVYRKIGFEQCCRFYIFWSAEIK